ncbi:hypothetical protein D7V93_14680 [Corallococcus llansteffanensis]|uniref:Uncharacterized protein n=1 Tax=Corallococcus llansteffanensis TaxID=2316731 RepID=A0A3A8PT09_9BACT|nr:hypothetical protein D7V93_14680 [Corallococcus llansteffanensis]
MPPCYRSSGGCRPSPSSPRGSASGRSEGRRRRRWRRPAGRATAGGSTHEGGAFRKNTADGVPDNDTPYALCLPKIRSPRHARVKATLGGASHRGEFELHSDFLMDAPMA